MSASRLIEELAGRGVRLEVEGNELLCRGPKKALTPEVLAQLKEHKEEILGVLSKGVTSSERGSTLGEAFRRYRDKKRARGGAAADLDSVRTDKEDFFSRDEASWREAWPPDFKVHGGGKA
jgi:hypothetical protein